MREGLRVARQIEVHSRPSAVEHWRHVAEIAALVIAAVWGLYVFVYQERIKPAEAPLEIQPVVTVDHTALASGKEFVKVDVTMKNIGVEPLQIDGLVVNVYGIRYSQHSGTYVETPLNGVVQMSRTLLPSAPSLLYSFYDTWTPFGSAKGPASIHPDGVFDESFAFALPSSRYDAAKVVWMMCWSGLDDRSWAISRSREPDGAYWISIPDNELASGSGLFCGHQRRGAFYPL